MVATEVLRDPALSQQLGRVFGRLSDPMPLVERRAKELLPDLRTIVWEGDPAIFEFSYVRKSAEDLLSNAIKFTDTGSVTVRCDVEPQAARVAVSDTGVGIPADKLEIIFEPFVQAESTLTRSRHGAGLGLAISRNLARAMGGDIAVASAVGVGSTFTLTLPRS